MNPRYPYLLLPVLASVLLLGGCAVNPVTGDSELAFVSESQELEIGKKNYAPYRQAQGGDYVVEPELTRYVRSVGDRLARVSDRPLPYEFNILNDSTPNAWALPGGKISINRGLLVELQSEAELAAVLGHEIVHAAARHSAQSMERGTLLQGALIATGVALGGSEYRDIGMLGAGLAAQLTSQKYSRDAESEADAYGMRYMQRAGYDPAAAVDLQETFVRLAEGRQQNWLEGLFASHPPSPERVRANRERLAAMGNPGGEIGAARYQQAIARLKRNKPAYAAYDEALAAFEKRDYAAALGKVNEAIRIEPDEALFYGLRGEIRSARDDDAAALKDLDRAVALNPDHYRPLLARGSIRRAAGDQAGAARDLQRSASLLPTAEAYYGLGRVAERQGRRDQALGYFRQAADSKSPAGVQAGRQLARLDLEDNPSRYLSSAVGLSKDGYLVVQLRNDAPVAVRDLQVVVGSTGAAGFREQGRFTVQRTLRAGEVVQARTDIGPMNAATARRFGVRVTAARLAE